jgi:hypothetical protein
MLHKLSICAKNMVIRGLRQTSRVLEVTIGYHLIRRHYYSPIPDAADIPESYWHGTFEMPGVDLGYQHGHAFMQDVARSHMASFRETFPLHKHDGTDFFLINGSYMAVDAHVYWAMIHHHKPRRIIEIGAGLSTMVAIGAADHLLRECGHRIDIEAIEPYPAEFLTKADGKSLRLTRAKVQDVPLATFETLESGDILFIDSSHVLRENNDVQYEYLQILPRLRAGVLVHIHDISLPRPYPRVYFENQLFWNEQYFLQAFLAFNNRFETIWAGNALMLRWPEDMMDIFPEIAAMRAAYPASEPTAFWMRVKE